MVVDLEQDPTADPYQSYLPRIVLHWDEDAPSSNHQQIEGSMVFVDISGFTALSERLAMLGKVGAEEVTEVLGACFKGLLAVAYPLGGRLIKFGGDALLLLFDSDGHEHRAVNAAVGMQHAMTRLGRVKTRVGNMTLKMSIGINSGDFHFFLVGESHRELILTGSAATATVEMEGFADATEIVVSRTTAATLPESSVGEPKGAGFLIRGPVPGVLGATVDVRPAIGELEQYIPVAVRQAVAAGANEPEHRQVTVAFLQFMGVDSLLDEKGPEAVARALSDLVARVQEAVDPRQVAFLATDIYDDGGKIILAAGAPKATGNDSERMLHALRDIASHQYELPIKVGVNRGHVFAGDVGPSYRRTYTIMGDDVNLAARLMSAATPGTIYATPVVLENSRTLFSTTALAPFAVKGKADPVQAFEVGEETGTRSARARDELPFTGRVEELAQLSDALERACNGEGSVVAIIGERGIGKTRLVQEAIDLQPDLPATTVRAEPYGTATPYRPFRDPARTILGIERSDQEAMARQMAATVRSLDPDLLAFLPLLGDVAHVEMDSTPAVDAIDPRFRQERLADVVIRILGLVQPGPFAIILEEGQWMDEASTELARRICAATAERPWTVLTTRTSGESRFEPDGSAVIELGPLDPADATSIVATVTEDRPLRPHEVDAIVRRVGGNALFLEEILSVVRETGSVADLPDSLDALVSAQIDALAPRPKRLLRYASVLGRSFRLSVLDEVLADDPLEFDSGARDSLVGFLVASGPDRMRFRHGLLRDVAYEGLSFRRRRDLHARAARATERLAGDNPDAVADLLALHFSIAGDYASTWRYARVAGDAARDAYANVDAATQYERALDAATKLRAIEPIERAGVWESLGDVREQVGLYEEAVEAFRHASRLRPEDEVGRADLMLKRARARMRGGSYVVALGEITRGLQNLKGAEDQAALAARARLTSFKGTVRLAQQKPREALKAAGEAVELARSAQEDEALARAFSTLDWAYTVTGEPDKAIHGKDALRIFEELGDLVSAASTMNNMGGMAYYDGKWDEARSWYDRCEEAFRRAGNDVAAAGAGALIGEVLVSQRRLGEAEPILRDAIRVLRASNAVTEAMFAETQLARLLIDRARLDEAHELLERIQSEARELGHTWSNLEAVIYFAYIHVLQGEAEEAIERLTAARSAAGDDMAVFAASTARVKAMALEALGRLDRASAEVEFGLAEARRQGLPYEEALLMELASELSERRGEPDKSLKENAEALYERLGILLTPLD